MRCHEKKVMADDSQHKKGLFQMLNNNIYALLIAVGDYTEINITDLNSFRQDCRLMKTSLVKGLKVEPDRIRCLDEEGKVHARSVATALANFSNMLTREDSLIIYFSGHGNEDARYCSDGELELNKIIKYIDQMPAKNKLLILDCCHSGTSRLDNKNSIIDNTDLSSYVGHGTAIIASSLADERAWVDSALGHSVFTGALADALQNRYLVKKVRIALDDVISEVRMILDIHNRKNSEGRQQIVFQANVGGTIYFDVEEYNPYRTLSIYHETEDYILYDVKPLNILDMKRLCAFIILKNKKLSKWLPEITKEVVEQIRFADVAGSRKMEKRFKGKSAQAIWCYFGYDESDMIRSLYFAYTIWAENNDIAKKYYRENDNAEVEDGIYIFKNNSYELVRDLQSASMPVGEYMKTVKNLYTRMISKTEDFIADIRKVENKEAAYREIFADYRGWIRDIYRDYYELTDLPCPPDKANAWSEKVLSLAGWIMDIALVIKETGGSDNIPDDKKWIIKTAIKHYYEYLEALVTLELG